MLCILLLKEFSVFSFSRAGYRKVISPRTHLSSEPKPCSCEWNPAMLNYFHVKQSAVKQTNSTFGNTLKWYKIRHTGTWNSKSPTDISKLKHDKIKQWGISKVLSRLAVKIQHFAFFLHSILEKKVFNTTEQMFPGWLAQLLTKQLTLINAQLTWTKLNSSFTELNTHKQETCIKTYKAYNTEIKHI